MEHHFNVEVACRYGMLEAVLLNHLEFWLKKNEANERNFYDGRYWTYNSVKALQKLFPYVSEHKIRNALKRLEDDGVIMTGNYNKSSYDRTMWYSISDKGFSILQNYKMEITKKQNGNDKKIKPIPDNNTDDYSDIIYNIVKYMNEMCGTQYRYSTRKTRELIRARLNEGFREEDFYEVIHKKWQEWKGTKMEQYLRPQTLFGTKFEAYLNQSVKSKNPFLDMLKEGT